MEFGGHRPFLMRGTSLEVPHPGLPLLLPPFLQKGGMRGGGGSRDALVLLPGGLPLLPLDFCPARGVEEPLVARSVHASSLLSPRFIRGLGIQELLSCGGLLLPALSRLPLPPHVCMPCEVVRRESLRSSAPVRVPPWIPDLRLGKPGRCFEPALGRMSLVTGLVAHAVTPLSVHG